MVNSAKQKAIGLTIKDLVSCWKLLEAKKMSATTEGDYDALITAQSKSLWYPESVLREQSLEFAKEKEAMFKEIDFCIGYKDFDNRIKSLKAIKKRFLSKEERK